MTARQEPLVDHALAREHGLSDSEWQRILELLGRTPTFPELGIFSVMWSEHCSYKSSRVHLRTLPTTATAQGAGPVDPVSAAVGTVLVGPGEGAGAVAIGAGLAVIFKIESHNHPSFIEPTQGAATGVGGILRDIFSMGARPIASLNSIRFGPLDDPKHRILLRGVVHGIGGYGNSVGVATVGGETSFHECYRGNILVNAFNLGIVPRDAIFLGQAAGVGNPVVYVGSKTGRDGIHGASLLASAEFDEQTDAKRPTVQVGDPFTEKCLIEACLDAMRSGDIVGIQDMGAAGLTCSSFEMASRAGTGIEMDLDRVPRRAANMTPYELLLSESQERMLLVTKQGAEQRVCEHFARWDLEAVVVGRVTDDGRMNVRWRGDTVVDIPVDPVAESAPCYERPTRTPAELGERQKLDLASIEPEGDPQGALEALLDAPNLASKAWIWRQYDSLVQGNTVIGPGGDAALVRVKHEDGTSTGSALAMSVDCNPRWCWLDPHAGTIAAVAESARNVACTGARPLALTNCLNFGSPEKPEIMWEFAESVRGLGEAARALGTPVISGNVSFYNETRGQAIFPTPTIAVVGLLDDAERHAVSHWTTPGLAIVLLGETREELGGSEWLAQRRHLEVGPPPTVDLAHEQRLHRLLAAGVAAGEIRTAHDVADGGLAVALAECCFSGPEQIGARVTLDRTLRLEALLFGESTGRVLVASADADALLARAAEAGVPARRIGETGGDRLQIGSRGGTLWIDGGIDRLAALWARGIPRRLEEREDGAVLAEETN
jgi:phosphoribosylformylglycinamidine synthase